MIICGLDLETTGLSPTEDVITEVGAVLWDTERNEPVKFFNKLLKIDRPVPKFITDLTGIDDALLQKFGEDPAKVWPEFNEFCSQAEMLMAHNAPFDMGFLAHQCPGFIVKPVVDSSVDVPYREEIKTRKLTHLCAEHGFVNPFAHRSVTDVLSMMQISSSYDWKEIIENATATKVWMRAMVTKEEKEKASSNGYRFNWEKKFWLKSVPESKVEQEVAKCADLGFLSKRVS